MAWWSFVTNNFSVDTDFFLNSKSGFSGSLSKDLDKTIDQSNVNGFLQVLRGDMAITNKDLFDLIMRIKQDQDMIKSTNEKMHGEWDK